MEYFPRGSERGASVLGALVVMLTFGAGTALLTTNHFDVDSQLAAPAATPASTPPKQTELQKQIEEKCKVLSEAAKQTGETQPKEPIKKDLKKGQANVEKDKCVSAYVISGTTKENRKVQCFGARSNIRMLTKEKDDILGEVVTVPDRSVSDKGTCKSQFVDADGKALSADQLKKMYEKASPDQRKAIVDAIGSQGSIDKSTQDALKAAMGTEQKGVEKELAEIRAARANIADQIKLEGVCDFSGPECSNIKDLDVNEEQLKKADGELKKKEQELLARSAWLTDNQKKLAAIKPESTPGTPGSGTPGEGTPGSGTAGGGTPAGGIPGSGIPGGSSGIPSGGMPSIPGIPGGGGGSGSGGGGQAGGGQPSNTFPQQQCNSQYICNGNAIYVMQSNCQQQLVQQCQNGCTSGSNTCNQAQQCLQAPAQPTTPCASGTTLRAMYGGQNNTCVIGWQCVAGTVVAGGPTASLSCQPKVADVGMKVSITWSCSAGKAVGSGFDAKKADGTEALSGSTEVTLTAPPGDTNTATYALTCTDQGQSSPKDCSVQVAKPGIVLTTVPKKAVAGKAVAIGWVTAGMDSCVISSEDLPDFTAQNANIKNINGGAETPILTLVNNVETKYDFLLHCTTVGGQTKDAEETITVVPTTSASVGLKPLSLAR